MPSRLTVTLHELVAELDIFADAFLRKNFGVSYNLFEYLATIAVTSPTDITDLAECLRVSKAAVSKRVPTLVEEGWIETESGAGRRVMITLSEKGGELVMNAGGALETNFSKMFTDPRINPAVSDTAIDTQQLNTYLRALIDVARERELPA